MARKRRRSSRSAQGRQCRTSPTAAITNGECVRACACVVVVVDICGNLTLLSSLSSLAPSFIVFVLPYCSSSIRRSTENKCEAAGAAENKTPFLVDGDKALKGHDGDAPAKTAIGAAPAEKAATNKFASEGAMTAKFATHGDEKEVRVSE